MTVVSKVHLFPIVYGPNAYIVSVIQELNRLSIAN